MSKKKKEILYAQLDLDKTILILSVGATITTSIGYFANTNLTFYIHSSIFFALASIFMFIAYLKDYYKLMKEIN
jgi:hypothetical protein|tara:strand:+ start:250 stop:471 length:222 start_codon:yes stop_codon:yes gene_type:complete